jgi:hypothetical protein
MMFGYSNTLFGGTPLPIHLDILGMPGCWLRVSPLRSYSIANPSGTATWTANIALDTVLRGVNFFNQGLVVDPGSNFLGVITTNGGYGTIGAK